MSLDASQKAKYDNKPFHLCTTTTPEISVKIGPSDSEKQPVESRPLKIFKKWRENIGKIYIPSGKCAEWAK